MHVSYLLHPDSLWSFVQTMIMMMIMMWWHESSLYPRQEDGDHDDALLLLSVQSLVALVVSDGRRIRCLWKLNVMCLWWSFHGPSLESRLCNKCKDEVYRLPHDSTSCDADLRSIVSLCLLFSCFLVVRLWFCEMIDWLLQFVRLLFVSFQKTSLSLWFSSPSPSLISFFTSSRGKKRKETRKRLFASFSLVLSFHPRFFTRCSWKSFFILWLGSSSFFKVDERERDTQSLS